MTVMSRSERLARLAAERERIVLSGAMRIAKLYGWHGLTRDLVAVEAGVSTGCVSKAFGSMSALKDAVMRQAVANQMLEIVAQGLAYHNEIARTATPELKARALATLG